MDHAVLIIAGGLAVGFLYGLFGVGSAFATPVLSLIGVGGMAAVVGPLPALLPGAAAGAWGYARQDAVDWRLARSVIIGAFPMAVLGAVASQWIGGPILLVLSGAMLLAVGSRIVRPGAPISAARSARLRASTTVVIASAAVVGFVSGLLANGGGFLLVPLFLLVLGLDLNRATGTSLVIAAALTIPTLATHAWLGDVDWLIAAVFAVGLVPGAVAGSRAAPLVPTHRLRGAFGVLLVGFGAWFLIRQVLAYAG